VVQRGGFLRCGHSSGRHVGHRQTHGDGCLAAVQLERLERCWVTAVRQRSKDASTLANTVSFLVEAPFATCTRTADINDRIAEMRDPLGDAHAI